MGAKLIPSPSKLILDYRLSKGICDSAQNVQKSRYLKRRFQAENRVVLRDATRSRMLPLESRLSTHCDCSKGAYLRSNKAESDRDAGEPLRQPVKTTVQRY